MSAAWERDEPRGGVLAEEPGALAVVEQLRRAAGGGGRLGVAFSGGVDSSVVLALGALALGTDRVLALVGVSPSLAARELEAARAVAAAVGVEVVEVPTEEGDSPAYRANGPDRCFHCKDELFTRIDDDVVAEQGLVAVAHGENADDVLRPDRPGARAAAEHGVLRPLADAGMRKADVRRVARLLRLPSADKPAAPCLASRIPHGTEVTPERLGQVERAEAALHDLGLREVRVRHHGDVARLETGAELLAALVEEPMRAQVVAAVRAAGFRFVAVDLSGLQSGAFTLPLVEVRRG